MLIMLNVLRSKNLLFSRFHLALRYIQDGFLQVFQILVDCLDILVEYRLVHLGFG